MNRDRQYCDTFPCFASLDDGLTPQSVSASLQSSHFIHAFMIGRGLPHSEPVYANHDHDH
jgi:hypothetical protein